MENNRPIRKIDWQKFLLAHGCTKRKTKGSSHEHWKCPNCIRTLTHTNQDKEIPVFHLSTNLKTMGYNLQYLYDWIEEN